MNEEQWFIFLPQKVFDVFNIILSWIEVYKKYLEKAQHLPFLTAFLNYVKMKLFLIGHTQALFHHNYATY